MATTNQVDITKAQSYLAGIAGLDITEALLSLSIKDMEYQGFDPLSFMANLFAIARTRKIDDAIHHKNMKTLAVLGTMRGSKITKIIEKSTGNTAAWLTTMQTTYGILNTKPTKADHVTLLRIAACHAASIIGGIHAGTPIKTTITPSAIHSDFPAYMCVSTFGSVVPSESIKEEDKMLIVRAFMWHQHLFDKVINPKNNSPKQKLMTYFDVQFTSGLYTEEQRVALLKKIGLITAASGELILSAQHRPALLHAAGKWDQLN